MVILFICVVAFISLISLMVFKAYHDVIDYREIKVGLPVNQPLRIFFISDIHTRSICEETIRSISESIDMVIIGGDLAEKGVPYEKVIKNLQLLHSFHCPVYFIWGNNDYEMDSNYLQVLLEQNQVRPLKNEIINFEHSSNTIHLIGLDYKKEVGPAEMDLEKVTGSCNILLTHDPKQFLNLSKEQTKSIDLVLSGHTHGGQIRFFGLGPYTRGGLKEHENTPLFISEGYGFTKLPFRLGTNAECHVIKVT